MTKRPMCLDSPSYDTMHTLCPEIRNEAGATHATLLYTRAVSNACQGGGGERKNLIYSTLLVIVGVAHTIVVVYYW